MIETPNHLTFVMARFMRAIQLCLEKKMDGPHKAGHDAGERE
jgi:hypothetical protein